MKKTSFLFLFLILSSCTKVNEDDSSRRQSLSLSSSSYVHEYIELDAKRIDWNSILAQEKEKYYVYFYSTTCRFCDAIKDTMIERILSEKECIFVYLKDNFSVILDSVDETIGLNKIDKFGILGYPSLIEVSNGVVTKNVAGKFEIFNILKIVI